MRNGVRFEGVGEEDCLLNNFRASAIGWGSPNRDTLFGPLRSWVYPKIFRSRRVKKAMAAKVNK